MSLVEPRTYDIFAAVLIDWRRSACTNSPQATDGYRWRNLQTAVYWRWRSPLRRQHLPDRQRLLAIPERGPQRFLLLAS